MFKLRVINEKKKRKERKERCNVKKAYPYEHISAYKTTERCHYVSVLQMFKRRNIKCE